MPFVTRRVRLLQELSDFSHVRVLNISGKANPSDAMTKVMKVKTTYREYMSILYNIGISNL